MAGDTLIIHRDVTIIVTNVGKDFAKMLLDPKKRAEIDAGERLLFVIAPDSTDDDLLKAQMGIFSHLEGPEIEQIAEIMNNWEVPI